MSREKRHLFISGLFEARPINVRKRMSRVKLNLAWTHCIASSTHQNVLIDLTRQCFAICCIRLRSKDKNHVYSKLLAKLSLVWCWVWAVLLCRLKNYALHFSKFGRTSCEIALSWNCSFEFKCWNLRLQFVSCKVQMYHIFP